MVNNGYGQWDKELRILILMELPINHICVCHACSVSNGPKGDDSVCFTTLRASFMKYGTSLVRTV